MIITHKTKNGRTRMLKIFVTGDNHFGKKYNRYPDAKKELINSRFECLKDMVRKAEAEACEFFIITGDLFDKTDNIKVGDVKQVVNILAGFSENVLILPGNHDYYTGHENVWKDFESALSSRENNITLLKEFREYLFESEDGKIVIYPAFCQSKHSNENNLNWIKNQNIQKFGAINIGIAHGAIRGITPDINEEYFLMSESELSSIPVDVWLIGHTHIPYPDTLKDDEDTVGYKIFNAGTHEQTDLHNNTEGNGFIISIEKKGSEVKVSARKYVSGKIRFYDLYVSVKPENEIALSNALKTILPDKDKKNSVIRLNIKGKIKQAEYLEKGMIYKKLLEEFLSYEIVDNELSEEITVERIRSEFAETSFAALFMEQLIDNPIELQMAYKLMQDCKLK
jgi:DNA repair exonuclease SbcCD nuclease subunit